MGLDSVRCVPKRKSLYRQSFCANRYNTFYWCPSAVTLCHLRLPIYNFTVWNKGVSLSWMQYSYRQGTGTYVVINMLTGRLIWTKRTRYSHYSLIRWWLMCPTALRERQAIRHAGYIRSFQSRVDRLLLRSKNKRSILSSGRRCSSKATYYIYKWVLNRCLVLTRIDREDKVVCWQSVWDEQHCLWWQRCKWLWRPGWRSNCKKRSHIARSRG